MRLLKAAGAHAGAVPSRHWYTEGRLQWMDECTSEKYYGWNSEVGNFPVTKPIIANFNVRANIVHRSNFCTAYEQWYWNYGPYLESGAEQKTVNDVVFRGTFANGKSLGSPFGYPSDYSAVKSFVMFDVPQNQTPVYSLACFQHAQLSYQGWQPTYIIGNSMCEPRSGSGAEDRVPTNPYLHRDITVHQAYYELGYGASWANDPRGGISTYKNAWDIYMDIDRPVNWGQWDDLIQNTTPAAPMDELFYYDASFTTNYALWDRYFLSSLPYTSAGTVDWNDNSRTLPNTRMTLNPYSSNTTAERTALITSRTNSFDYAAYFLLNQGAFNINSTSVEAWRAFFSSMNDVNRPTRDGKAVTAAFSRLLIPNTKEPAGDHLSSGPWNSVRVLTEGEIDTLAQEIVRIVRTRGPFLGLADFVNRRLVKVKGPGDIKTDASLCGPLQAAIEAAGLNSALQNTSITSPALGGQAVTGGDAVDRDARRGGWSFDNRSLNPDFWAFAPWKTFGAPGYLTQADVLQSIGANLTARGDTFLIRGYGEARDAKDNVTAKAWCETVVQRTPDYLTARSITAPSTTGGNNPLDPPTVRSTTDYSLSINPNLAPINKTFGRRFVVKQFRWLNPSEI